MINYSNNKDYKQIIKEYDIPESMYSAVIPMIEAKAKGIMNTMPDIEEVDDLIDSFDAVVSIGLSKEYIDKRSFNQMISIRELLQNALDEAELTSGKPDANVSKDKYGLWIEDSGRGINIEAFRMGGNSKETWMRGFYGEGLKLAASYLTLNDIPVYFFSKDNVYRFIVLNKDLANPSIFLLLGKTKKVITGTKILLSKFNVDESEIKKLVRFWNPELKDTKIAEEYFSSKDCDKEMPSAIFNYPDSLYIRNMFVGKMSDVAKREGLLSYDLWWFRLDVSRKLMSQNVPLLFIEIGKVLSRSEPARKIFVEKLVESGMLKLNPLSGGTTIEFNPIFATIEGHLFVYTCPKGMIDTFIDVLGLKEQREKIRRVESVDEAKEAIEAGYLPMQLHYELTEELNVIPPFRDKK